MTYDEGGKTMVSNTHANPTTKTRTLDWPLILFFLR